MKATDLMIGDYVFWNWATHKVDFDGDVMTDRGYKVSSRIIKVSSVNEGGITFKSLKDGSQISIKEEDLVPIPLTPEILEKNGFIPNKFNTNDVFGTRFDLGDHYYLTFYNSNRGGSLTKYYTSQSIFYITTIEYVHELQHALRLCGIEKEIEL